MSDQSKKNLYHINNHSSFIADQKRWKLTTTATTSRWGRTGCTPAPPAAPGSRLLAVWPGDLWGWSVSVTGVCTSLRPDTTHHGWLLTPYVAKKITLTCLLPVGWQWKIWRRQRKWQSTPGAFAKIITRACKCHMNTETFLITQLSWVLFQLL